MQTLTLEAEIHKDGRLRLDVPVGLPPGKIELVLIMQPEGNGIKQNGIRQSTQKPRQEIFDELEQLLRIGLAGVTWEEIQEGRSDDENRY